ncbi:MAG TPA: DNA translocase FtsK 4TM domain-containing protein, partial [Acidimicrobiales bacterium]|nr:DNA translocase FtsK 4TM domain-containing protein [Acidimicrobiales bacterium]
MVDGVFDVLAEHAQDLWALASATVGVLLAIALFAGSLGPVGHGLRQGLSEALGVGRFVVPLGCLGGGVLLVVGRPRYEPARAVLGLALALVSVSGLADLAGGAPHLGSSTARLAGAGGWLGVLTGGPLRTGLAGWGAAVVLVALFLLAVVLFTGTTVRQAADVAWRAAAATWAWPRRGIEVVDDEPVDDEPVDTDPSSAFTGAGRPPTGDEDQQPPSGSVSSTADVAPSARQPDERGEDAGAASPVTVAVTSAGRSDQLALDAGMAQGEWRLPPLKMLSRSKAQELDRQEISAAGRALVAALGAHGVETRLVGHTVGPTVTRFELELGPGVKVARVTSLNRDIAYAMASPDVRILAPIPGRSAIGVEVPNRQRQLVTLGDVLSTEEARRARQPLEVALGRDIAGRPVMVNLADMPHILISGATGAGKSSCINSLLTSVLMRSTPEQVRLILVDPKRVELGQYNGLPHLLTQVVVDPKKAANALAWAVTEMERRYDLLAEAGMRDIGGYN